jgi:hypothetical protein
MMSSSLLSAFCEAKLKSSEGKTLTTQDRLQFKESPKAFFLLKQK